MDLHICKQCGVVVDFDNMKDIRDERDKSKSGYKFETDSTIEFYCPCCNKWVCEVKKVL